MENQDWATRPPGRRAVADRGPPGCRGPWAVGRGPWAVGRGPWAVGRGPWAVGRGPWVTGGGPPGQRGPWAVGRGPVFSKTQEKRGARPPRPLP